MQGTWYHCDYRYCLTPTIMTLPRTMSRPRSTRQVKRRLALKPILLRALVASFALGTVAQAWLPSIGSALRIPHIHSASFATTQTRLYSSPADADDESTSFPEYLDGNEEGVAPTKDNDNYVSEREESNQANELLLRTGGSHVELQTELSNSFLQYALSIILGRAIPDARDGLKPVHRRILFAMHELQMNANSSYRKCARVVGDVLGKLHPHGDTAVYDALVRLAQDFTTNHPLIDGHGNFGSIDADPAAAMRYTECRLTPLSQASLLSDLSENTVDRIPNFDGTSTEPVVLPAKVPVLLLNGSAGIAVGMATNIPPHNLKELLTACSALAQARMEGSMVSTETLIQMVPGPDFPTRATILGRQGAEKLYRTGNGGIVMRAVTKMEQVGRSDKRTSRTAIVVTELPYQVNKAALLEKIADLVNDKKLEGIADLRDESSGREGIRVVIELKRDAVAAVVLANLYKKTALQTTFAGNFLALMTRDTKAGGNSLVPQRFTLRQALDCFLDFRFDTIRRKAAYQLDKVEKRSHIVEGLLLALEQIDQVIEIVRASPNAQAARTQLQEQLLGTTNEQTDSILRLQLGQLTRLNKGKLQDEQADLSASRKELTELLQVDNIVYQSMVKEFGELSKKFGRDRQTVIIEEDTGDLDELDLIRNSRSVIVVTRGGYIKRMPLKTFSSQGRGTRGKKGTSDSAATFETEVAHCFTCNDHDTLLMVSDAGIAYGVPAYQVPTSSRTAKGHPLPSVLSQLSTDESVTTILPISDFDKPDEYLVLATEQGWIKKTGLAAFKKIPSRGLVIAKLEAYDRLLWCQQCHDGDDILVGTHGGMATRFEAAKLRPTARTSRGVRTMKLKEGDKLADVNVLDGRSKYVLAVSRLGFGKRIQVSDFRAQARGGQGVVALKFKKKGAAHDSMTCLQTVKETDEILVITERGIMVRQKVSEIPSQGRAATGVAVQKLDDSDIITSVSIVPEYEETDPVT